MKITMLKLALQSLLFVVATTVGVSADDVRSPAVRFSSLEAKVQYCGYCHGASGQGYHGYYAMPRLAGQQSEYFVNQLRAFAEERRDIHFGMKMSKVHGLSPTMRLALAKHFSAFNPRPFDDGRRDQVALGRQIFEDGVPNSNIPACGACHAADGRGAGANPRLAGQLYAYTVWQLANWSKDRGQVSAHPDSSAVMLPIARSMSKQQMTAVAAYVSSLK